MVAVLTAGDMTDAEFALGVCAQGILNRKGKKIYTDIDCYMDYLSEPYERVSLWRLIAEDANEFIGAAVFDLNCNDVGVNMAATLSAAYDILGVPRELIGKVNSAGIKTVCDLAEIRGTPAERQRVVFDGVKDRLNKTALIHQVVKEGNFHLTLRDFGIKNGWACIYTDESEADRAFRRYVLGALDKNVPVYGWNDDEIAFIKDVSDFGDYAIPTDWSCNHSYFAAGGAIKQRRNRSAIAQNKHYVALVVSDGDNVQWLERDFATTGTFGQRCRSTANYKLNWTFAPSLVSLCPAAAERIYAGAKNDYFISGVSGIGYANCLSYPRDMLAEFTAQTAEAMARSDLDVVCLLDNIEFTKNAEFTVDRLSFYAEYGNIIGGIWELDPDRYGSGRGKIFWANGKPFVSVKYTMWHPSGNPQCVTREWLDGIAKEVNSQPIAPQSESGYSVVNVHPWTIDVDDLDYFVSKLGDNIELVYADELIELVKKNVRKK
ncbi:MAG: hypothetical protein K2M89_04565 [Clostridiales bacterium]|nr:hypothetical protein [Clostridiales bacterium]